MWLAFLILSSSALPHHLLAFDDTLFDQATLEDLDQQYKASKAATPPPDMLIKPDLIDAGDLPVVGQPTDVAQTPPVESRVEYRDGAQQLPSVPVMEEPPPQVKSVAQEPADVISLSREDAVVGTEDLEVVGAPSKLEPPTFAPEPMLYQAAPAPAKPEDFAPPSSVTPEPLMIPLAAPEAEAIVIPPVEPLAITDPMDQPPSQDYTGPSVSAYLVNVPTASAIKAITAAAGQRVILPEDIPGSVTLHVEDRPWKWVVDALLTSKPYVAVIAEDTLVVSEDSGVAKGPALQRTFKLRHALPSTLATKLKPFLTQRGRIYSDDAGSMVVVHDVPAALATVTKIIRAADIPQRKVLIEAKLVEMEDSVAKQFGINWSLAYTDAVNLVTGTISNTVTASTATRLGLTAQDIGSNGEIDLSMFLDLLETGNKVNVISSPSVLTLNNQEASVGQTEQFVYPIQVNGTAGSTIAYASLNADTLLKIRPRIVENNAVEMDIYVKRAFPNDINNAALPQKFDKQQASTKLVVRTGETAVIGGLKAERTLKQKQGTPILKDVPILGLFFGNEREVAQKKELMIFIKPQIQ